MCYKCNIGKPGRDHVQVIIIPGTVRGNLTQTILSARQLADYLILELRDHVVVSSVESGLEGAITAAQKSGISFGIFILIGTLSFLLYQAWNKPDSVARLQLLQHQMAQYSVDNVAATNETPFQVGLGYE